MRPLLVALFALVTLAACRPEEDRRRDALIGASMLRAAGREKKRVDGVAAAARTLEPRPDLGRCPLAVTAHAERSGFVPRERARFLGPLASEFRSRLEVLRPRGLAEVTAELARLDGDEFWDWELVVYEDPAPAPGPGFKFRGAAYLWSHREARVVCMARVSDDSLPVRPDFSLGAQLVPFQARVVAQAIAALAPAGPIRR